MVRLRATSPNETRSASYLAVQIGSLLAVQFVVIMGTKWSVLIPVDRGVKSFPPIFVHASRTMGSKGLHTLVKVILPSLQYESPTSVDGANSFKIFFLN